MQDAPADVTPQEWPQLLVRTKELLQANDDTSRFAGLSLLRSLLDVSEKLRNDPEVVSKFWDAIPRKFLVRLLNTDSARGRSLEDAKRLNEIAVAVIHTFVSLLPKTKIPTNQKLAALCVPIVDATPRLDPAPRIQAFQVLQALAHEESNLQLVGGALVPWQRLTSGDEVAVREYGRLIQIMRNISSLNGHQLGYIDSLTAEMVSQNKPTNRTPLFDALTTIYQDTGISHAILAERTIVVIQETILVSKPTTNTIKSTINLAAVFVHHPSPDANLNTLLLTKPTCLPDDPDKPFASIFPTLLATEIRSTLPTLLDRLALSTYPQTALNTANAYDLLTAFTAFLTTPLAVTLPPTILLTLRSALHPTLTQTAEFLRHRYDAAITAAPGLSADARRDLRVTADWRSAGPVRSLTWDSPAFDVFDDPIVVSGLRWLALWIREDEGEELRGLVSGMVDVLLDIVGRGTQEGLKISVCVILAVLVGDEEAEEVVDEVLGLGGWDVLAKELRCCFGEIGDGGWAERTQDVVRVLLGVIESDAVPATREAWMDVVSFLASVPLPLSGGVEEEGQVEGLGDVDGWVDGPSRAEGKGKGKAKLVKADDGGNENILLVGKLQAKTVIQRMALDCENLVSAYQLAVALVIKAPPRLKRRFQGDWKKIKENAEIMLEFGVNNGEVFKQGIVDGLKEVIEGFESVEAS